MLRTYKLILSILFCSTIFAQEYNNSLNTNEFPQEEDSTKLIYRPIIQDYQFLKENSSKTIFDTVLTIDKYYKNRIYNHKDYFGTMPFGNQGQTFNPLLYTTEINSEIQLIPQGKFNNLLGINDIRYFDVKTPTTEFQYNNGTKEGQVLSTVFTHNLNPRWNYSLEYKGLRSRGKYLEDLSSSDAFIVTSNYHTKNNLYKLWTHYIAGNVDNKENGGIKYLENFEDGDSRFKGRDRLDVNLREARSKYNYRRYHLGQKLGILKSDEKYWFSLKNIFTYESSYFTFSEDTNNTYYDTIISTKFGKFSKKYFNKISNSTYASIDTDKFKLNLGAKIETPKLKLDEELSIKDQNDKIILTIPKKIDDTRFGFVGDLDFNWKENLKLNTQGEFMSGDYFKTTFFIDNKLYFQPVNKYSLEANLGIKSVAPSLNLLANQSYYKNFNYYLSDFNNEKTFQTGAAVKVKPFDTKLSAQFYNIANYTYLNGEGQSKQASSDVRIMQYQLENLFSYKKFHLKTQLAYQKVIDNSKILPLPEFVGRATLYYQTKLFKDNAEIQTGFNAYYFSSFDSRVYLPVVNEFRLQNSTDNDKMGYEIGDYPVIDLFLHLKVKRMLIIFEAQHFNSSFTGYKYYSAPRSPYADFRLNIGILWYLFT